MGYFPQSRNFSLILIVIGALGILWSFYELIQWLRGRAKQRPRRAYDSATPTGAFLAFLELKLRHADELLADRALDNIVLSQWSRETFAGIRTALGTPITDESLREMRDSAEYVLNAQTLHTCNLEQLRARLDMCKNFIEEIKESVFPEHLVASFNPRDLNRYEGAYGHRQIHQS